jgi:hypothetical protein
MIIRRPAAVLINCVLFVAVLGSASPEQHTREASANIRSKLFRQVLADFKDLRECIEQEEGGARAAEEKTTIEEVDLNRDGVPEYEVEMGGACACGAANCSIYIYRRVGEGFESMLDDASGLGVEVLKSATSGYADLVVTAHDTAATQYETTYKFDGRQYRESKNTLVQLETGERRPAFRRVQFKRGTSSATLQGKVSIALSDTYLLGARAGQVMTVKLTAARKAVRFLVMSPTTRSLLADNARDWTGTLQETGDYHIIIDADEVPSTYSITITIK